MVVSRMFVTKDLAAIFLWTLVITQTHVSNFDMYPQIRAVCEAACTVFERALESTLYSIGFMHHQMPFVTFPCYKDTTVLTFHDTVRIPNMGIQVRSFWKPFTAARFTTKNFWIIIFMCDFKVASDPAFIGENLGTVGFWTLPRFLFNYIFGSTSLQYTLHLMPSQVPP